MTVRPRWTTLPGRLLPPGTMAAGNLARLEVEEQYEQSVHKMPSNFMYDIYLPQSPPTSLSRTFRPSHDVGS